jgi:integrase
MERDRNLLTSRGVETAKDGWHTDGGNLYLRVDGDRRRWIVRVTRGGKKRDFGVGGADKVSLKLARQKRDRILAQLADGLDPVAEKREAREAEAQAKAAKAARKTFGEAARAVFRNREPAWKKGSSTSSAWVRNLNKDCKPLLKMPVAEIGVHQIKSVVEPYWERGKFVAGRALLSRIEAVLDYAFAHEWRPEGDNPAAWKRFVHLFPARPNGGKRPHPMVKWPDMPAFLTKLRKVEDSMSAVVLELITLTACRSNEIRGLRWSEVDFKAKVITIPPERMKRSIEFKVPLSEQALGLLRPPHEAPGRPQQLVFPGPKDKPLINQSLWKMIRRVTGKTATTHGLRASFGTWASENGVTDELLNMCLAHAKKDQTIAAYNRAENVERRRVVMQNWANFLDGVAETGKVRQFRSDKRRR